MQTESYVCTSCGYIYDPLTGDPEHGIDPETSFEALPRDWVCPLCYTGRDGFDPL